MPPKKANHIKNQPKLTEFVDKEPIPEDSVTRTMKI